MTRVFALAALAALLVGCASARPPSNALGDPTAREWTRVRQRLALVRSTEPGDPFVERISVTVKEPRTERRFEARGAVAIDPHRAMRMILVGPGGATALDAWVTDDAYKFVVPPLSLTKRGGKDAASARGLPIGFFRWWMLHPFDGKLLAGWMRHGDPIYLLRDGGSTALLRDHKGTRARHVIAIRREGGESERLEWVGHSLLPREGDFARYVDGESGLEVEMRVEGVSTARPDPAAFVDPDLSTEGTPL